MEIQIYKGRVFDLSGVYSYDGFRCYEFYLSNNKIYTDEFGLSKNSKVYKKILSWCLKHSDLLGEWYSL